MAKQTRVTWFFRNEKGYGWTEALYAGDRTLLEALNLGQILLPFRVNMLGLNAKCYLIRVSDDLIKRDVKKYRVPLADQNGKLGFTGSDIANTCLQFPMVVTDQINGSIYSRGQPDEVITNGGEYTPGPAFQGAVDAWAAAIKTRGPYYVKVINPPPPDGTGPVATPIANLTQNAVTGIITVTTTVAHGLPNVYPFGGTNITGLPQGFGMVRGQKKILSVPDATSFTIASRRILPPYLFGGRVQKLTFMLGAIINVDVPTPTHRITGSPSTGPRGRRRVR